MVIKGLLISCKREVKVFKNGQESKDKLWITLKDVKLSDEKKKEIDEAFKDSGKNMTPEWVKNFEGYVNVSTQYPLPCMDADGNEYGSIERLIQEDKYPFMGAEVLLSMNVKEGAVYPNSIKFLKEGTPFNPFTEFDNYEED